MATAVALCVTRTVYPYDPTWGPKPSRQEEFVLVEPYVSGPFQHQQYSYELDKLTQGGQVAAHDLEDDVAAYALHFYPRVGKVSWYWNQWHWLPLAEGAKGKSRRNRKLPLFLKPRKKKESKIRSGNGEA